MQKGEELRFCKIMYNTSLETFEKLSELDKMCIGSEGWSPESFRTESAKENGYVLCYFFGNRIVALLAGYSAIGEGDIMTVATHPDFRRKGLAEKLLYKFESMLPEDTEYIFLEVRESNTPAISLYTKYGFEKISVRKSFYSEPVENAIVMRKKLI